MTRVFSGFDPILERFEPIGTAGRKRVGAFLQRLLPAHQFGLLGGVIVSVDYAVEKRIQEPLQAEIDLLDLGLLFSDYKRGGLGGLPLFLFNQLKHPVRPIGPESIWLQESRNLRLQGFLADIGLGAPLDLVLLGAAVIRVSLLDFGADSVAAFGTAEKTGKRFRHPFLLPGRPAPAVVDHRLDLVEKLFGNDGFMLSLMRFTDIAKMAVVKGVAEYLGQMGARQESGVPGVDSVGGEKLPDIVECHISGCIHLKRLANDRCKLAINDDCLCAVVVQITERSRGGVFPASDLFAKSALGVFGQGIDVIFALAEHD